MNRIQAGKSRPFDISLTPNSDGAVQGTDAVDAVVITPTDAEHMESMYVLKVFKDQY